MLKKIYVCLTLGLILLCSFGIVEAATIDSLRFSTGPSKVRLVLDSKEIIKYKVTKLDKEIVVDLLQSSCKDNRPIVKDPLIKEISLVSLDKKASRLLIRLNKNCQFNTFTLANPFRLVIDLQKIEKLDKTQPLAAGVEYRFIQDELDGHQFQAHIAIIKPEAAYELHPFSAAGRYNGRGSLLKGANDLKALVAVNSSYFDTDGWVVGVTKDRGKMLSMEELPRSAYINSNGRSSVVKDVSYTAYLQLADGTKIPIKGMNRRRIAEDCVIFNEAYSSSTKTNQWGREIKICKGKVISASNKGNMPIEPGTIIVSGHGVCAGALNGVKVGDSVELVESLGNSEAERAELVVGGGPLLVENNAVKVRAQEEKIPKDIAIGRSPRTALGIRADGALLLVVVDGRSLASCGMSLKELGQFLLKLGAKEGLNFDGGGSSEMVVRGRIVNRPSDGRERLVSMGLGLFKKRN